MSTGAIMIVLLICSLGSVHLIGQAPYNRWRYAPALPYIFSIALILLGCSTKPDAWPLFVLMLPFVAVLHIIKVKTGRLGR